jgi:hypothetical protein
MMKSRLDSRKQEAHNARNLLLWEQEVFSWATSRSECACREAAVVSRGASSQSRNPKTPDGGWVSSREVLRCCWWVLLCLNRPTRWIPAFAGMTLEGQAQGPAPTGCGDNSPRMGLVISEHHGQASLRPCHQQGCAEGRSPFASILRLSSSLKPRARREGAGTRPCRGFGGVLQLLFYPPRVGARGLNPIPTTPWKESTQ